ncbi:unnamed protein product [Hydatigera taeniaeformis]|uniref:Kinesin motor domain-containing protein n=1 Tax=Hydatigena taeniaeformis TaxID=6205 RepID=A0A0R3X3T2_HYDTA|nr:unnamed protein product [Hydatigera taeniaeformis]
MKEVGICKETNAPVEMQMPVGRLFEVISLFKTDRQNILKESPLKRPPTDFITSQDWSIYVKICCHLRQNSDRQQFKDDSQGRSCLIRLVSAFNQLYTEYSLICDAVEKARDNSDHFLNKEKASHSQRNRDSTKDGREKGDEGHSLDFPPPEQLREVLMDKPSFQEFQPSSLDISAGRMVKDAPTGCCAPIRRRGGKISLNSGDIFDCIQRQPPEASIWVKQLKISVTQTVLTANFEVDKGGRSRLEAVKLPIALELTLPRIQRQVQTIMTVCPFIYDPLEVIAELRATNYDTDGCVDYFEKTKCLREVIQEFLPTRTLRPAEHRPLVKTEGWPNVSGGVLGMSEEEIEGFLLHNKQRLQTIRRLQKDAVRRIQRLHTFSSGLVSVMEQVLLERESHRKSMEKEGAIERYRDLTDQLNTLTEENTKLRETLKKEEERRKLLFNMIQEYLGNIRVFCRVRAIPQTGRILEVTAFDTISLNVSPLAEEYKFDRAFDVNTSQAEVYAELVPLICSFMDGFNVSFLTYGGESSGKTYTLMGGMDGSPESQGVVYRALRTVLLEKATRRAEWDICLKVGVVEIYNETLIDLISGESGVHLRVDAGADRMLDTLQTVELQTETQIDELLQLCNDKRKIARTALNEASSRSHLIILVRVRATSNIYQKTMGAVLAMCDLAGFEDIIKADTMGDQVLAKEAGFINRSLTALNRVLTSLKTQSPMSVSYRDSKLTYLLKPFFTNSGKCILIVTVRTDKANLPSTQGTLRFGRDSRAVNLGRARRQVSMEKLIQDVGTV